MSALNLGAARNPVQLIGVNAPFEPKIQFGRAYQPNDNIREKTHSNEKHVTRVADNNHGINQPAPVREQTILRSNLSPQLQRELNIGFSGPQNQGRMAGNQFPQLDSIAAKPQPASNQRHNYQVTPSAHVSGSMQLRLVKG